MTSPKHGVTPLSQLGLASTARPREDTSKLVTFISKVTYLPDSVDPKGNT